MARTKTYIIKLSDDEKAELQKTIHNKKTSKTILKRCQILENSRFVSIDLHFICSQLSQIGMSRFSVGVFHPHTPGILAITAIKKMIVVITRLKWRISQFADIGRDKRAYLYVS